MGDGDVEAAIELPMADENWGGRVVDARGIGHSRGLHRSRY